MNTLFTYLIESFVCWAVLLAFYQLVLRKSTFYQLSRFYLVAAMIMGAVIPLIPGFYQEPPPIVYAFQGQIDEFVVGVTAYTGMKSGAWFIDWNLIGLVGYGFICSLMLIRLALGIRKIFKIEILSKKWIQAIEINFHQENLPPFSFLKRIFIPQDYPENILPVVTKHELTHVRQGHTLDILFSKLLTIVFWINPMLRLFDSYLKEVHENYADQTILASYDYSTYQRALKYSAFTALGLPVAHAINSNNIKKRLINMKKMKSPSIQKLFYIAILPIAVCLSFAMNNYKQPTSDEAELPQQINEQLLNVIDTIPDIKTTEYKGPTANENGIYDMADEMPRFPGCENEKLTSQELSKCANRKLLEYIFKNVKYPSSAVNAGVEGVVVSRFVVGKDGLLRDVVISRNIGHGCGDEVLRIINLMNSTIGNWVPGRVNGNAVAVQYVLPVKFRMENDKPDNPPPSPPPPADSRASGSTPPPPPPPPIQMKEKEEIYKIVKEKPRFPGCEDVILNSEQKEKCGRKKMLDYLYKNLHYPVGAKENNTEGTVVISYVVEMDGSLSDIRIIRDIKDGCGKEAARVIHQMNDEGIKWIPGKRGGRAVRVQYNLPVQFKLGTSKKITEHKIYNNNTIGSIEESNRTRDEIFKIVEQMPRFPGCENRGGSDAEKKYCAQQKMLEFLYENVKYPIEAKLNGIEGTAVVRFIVRSDGSLSDFKIVRDVPGNCGTEALRVVKLMNQMPDRWTPGHQRGRVVNVQYNLPIKFKLQSEDPSTGEF